MNTRLQRSAIHEAAHTVVADFLGLRVRYVSLLPEGESPGDSLAHVGVEEELESITGASVLAAGEEAVRLAETGDRPAPEMPASRPWHTRALSIGERACGRGFHGDRERIRQLVDAEEAAFARRQARMILRQEWGAVYGLADRLLRTGVMVELDVQAVLHPERSSESAQVIYDASASTEGLLWGPGPAPPATTEEREPERHLEIDPRVRRRGRSPVPAVLT